MAFEASDYVIWMVFTFLEALAIRFSRNKPELKPIRSFMALCLMRDFILLVWSCHLKYFWVSYWITQQIELIGFAMLAGIMIGNTRPWRFPAFTIAAMCVHYAFMGWPITALPEEIFHFERNCCLIILGTMLIGAVFTFAKNQLPLAGAVGILVLSDTFSAQSFLMENYSPRLASVIWAVGAGTLVAVARATPGPQHNTLAALQAAAASTTDSRSTQGPQSQSEARLLDEASALKEWLTLPCHTPIQ